MIDQELLAEAAGGSVDALAALYDRYAPLMLGVARRMLRDPAAAEDLVHDVFIEAWRNADRYVGARGSVRTWLLVRLRSRAFDRLRSEQLRQRKREPGLGVAVVGEAAHDSLQRAPDRQLVVEGLARLDARQRETLELAYFQGLSAREIAERTQAPVGTVKSRLAAGLSRLRQLVLEAPVGVSADAGGAA